MTKKKNTGHYGGKDVEAYIAKAQPAAQRMMKQLRSAIKSTAPKAKERISYGIPFYEYRTPGYAGRMIYFAGFANHVGLYVVPRSVPVALAKTIQPYRSGRSTLRFPIGKKIPLAAIRQLVKIRMKEIDLALS